jgi:hypothetical protein
MGGERRDRGESDKTKRVTTMHGSSEAADAELAARIETVPEGARPRQPTRGAVANSREKLL